MRPNMLALVPPMLLLAAMAQARQSLDSGPPRCGVILRAGETLSSMPPPVCPKFQVLDFPGDDTPTDVYVNDPIALFAECLPRIGGMRCDAWPQEYDTEQYLTYQWTIRVGFDTTHYPASSNPSVSFSCQPLNSVSATVTVTNGTYQASQSLSYGCGNEIQ